MSALEDIETRRIYKALNYLLELVQKAKDGAIFNGLKKYSHILININI